ncbi:MAG: hypothetical protein J3K34DRAFT_497713, partial [Monoraphidium minutum]
QNTHTGEQTTNTKGRANQRDKISSPKLAGYCVTRQRGEEQTSKTRRPKRRAQRSRLHPRPPPPEQRRLHGCLPGAPLAGGLDDARRHPHRLTDGDAPRLPRARHARRLEDAVEAFDGLLCGGRRQAELHASALHDVSLDPPRQEQAGAVGGQPLHHQPRGHHRVHAVSRSDPRKVKVGLAASDDGLGAHGERGGARPVSQALAH